MTLFQGDLRCSSLSCSDVVGWHNSNSEGATLLCSGKSVLQNRSKQQRVKSSKVKWFECIDRPVDVVDVDQSMSYACILLGKARLNPIAV